VRAARVRPCDILESSPLTRGCQDRLVKAPQNIIGEWGSLTRVHSAEPNLRSLRLIRDWLDCVEQYLDAGGDPDGDPQLRNYTPSNAVGLTSGDFDGVPMATLRFWLQWWERPERTWCGAEEAGRDPAAECEKVRREIEARGGK
jgi:hypothetical protein